MVGKSKLRLILTLMWTWVAPFHITLTPVGEVTIKKNPTWSMTNSENARRIKVNYPFWNRETTQLGHSGRNHSKEGNIPGSLMTWGSEIFSPLRRTSPPFMRVTVWPSNTTTTDFAHVTPELPQGTFSTVTWERLKWGFNKRVLKSSLLTQNKRISRSATYTPNLVHVSTSCHYVLAAALELEHLSIKCLVMRVTIGDTLPWCEVLVILNVFKTMPCM